MTDHKDDGGLFHPALSSIRQYHGSTYRAVGALTLMAAWLSNPELRGTMAEGAKYAVEATDILIAELKK